MFLTHDPPPIPYPTQQEWSEPSFKPGDWKQDIFTLPLEAGLISSLSYFYTPRSKTLFSIDESTDRSNNATTWTRSHLLPYAIGTGALVFGGLTFSNDHFSLGLQARGFAHAILLSEVAATSAKVIFQKKRPNYDDQISGNNGVDKEDARASFYSDHASQAFVFSTYTSLLMFQYSNSLLLNLVYSATAFSAASMISYSRVGDHAHNLFDVVVGVIMGTTISGLTFFRVQEVNAQLNHPQNSSNASSWQWNIAPSMEHDNTGRTWYMANLEVEI